MTSTNVSSVIQALQHHFDTDGLFVKSNDYCHKIQCSARDILASNPRRSFVSASFISRRHPFLFLNKEFVDSPRGFHYRGFNYIHGFNTSLGHMGVIYHSSVSSAVKCAYADEQVCRDSSSGLPCARADSKPLCVPRASLVR